MRLIFTFFTILSCLYSIAQPPNAQFTASPLSVCLGQPISFTNQSTAGGSPITSYSWDFGDGSPFATTPNTNYVYAAPGTYTVTLVVQAQNGQADAEVKQAYVVVNPLPTASFTTSGNGCTVPFAVTFTNTSTSGPGISYSWNFGNGQNSTVQNPPAVTYASAGTFNVTLTVTNSNSGCTATTTQSIVVSNYAAGITGPATACVGSPVTFQDNSTVGVNSWSWSADPGTSSLEDPIFTFNAPGTYTVSLTSQNTTSGCSASATHQIQILPLPVPSMTAVPATGCAPLPVTFTNTSPPGTNFIWDFGDGTTFSGQNPPSHTYQQNGSYNVSLTMTGANGCVGTYVFSNAVVLSEITAQFVADVYHGCTPLEVQFTDASITPNPSGSAITTWQWNFGNGNTFNGQNPPVQTYPIGIYDVSLTITTANGCTATAIWNDSIQVGEILDVNFTVGPIVECAKTNINFTNLSVITAPHGPNEVTYYWDFGDNSNSTEENPTHQYQIDTGYFDVSLIVDFRGCKDTMTIPNAVRIKAPISIFNPSSTLFCNPASFPVNVPVTDNSIIGQYSDDVSMIWRWGDGSETHFDDADIEDPDKGSTSHNYTAYGSYTIKQVIYNYTTGCADSTTQTIHISQTVASFNVSNDSVCRFSPIQMTSTSTSTHPLATWSYNMGNGQTVNSGPNPSYNYNQAGTFTITLTATNEVGCSHTATFNPMRVLELPLAQLTADDNTGCVPFLVTFDNTSVSQSNVPLSSFAWSFSDDNSTQTTTNVNTDVTHTFMSEGNFTVSLVVTDQFGCISPTASIPITITKPVAVFTVDTVVCDLEFFTSSNGSTGFGPLSYQWLIDGQQTATTPNITDFYDETPSSTSTHVTHVLTLITTDGNGCKDTASVNMVVSLPVAGVSYVLDGASVNEQGEYTCPPVYANFTDQSDTYGDISSWSWIFGDGKQSTLQDPSNTYVFPGTYTASLTITDEFGCTSDTVLFEYLTIFGPSGTPSWTQSADGCGQEVTFTLDNLVNVDSWTWDTGDGETVNDSVTFQHTYLSVDTFNPTVTLMDELGCVVIYPMPPIVIPDNGLNAFFTANLTTVKLGANVTFDDQSTSPAPIVAWEWNFGDGSGVTNFNGNDVSHIYYSHGNKTVVLTITDANGCKDQYKVVIYVDPDFDMPNVFTPNGDGSNEQFTLYADIFKSFDIIIQNRWGNVLTDRKNQTGILLWDGKDKGGEVCNDGVYFYQFTGKLDDGAEIKKAGFVTLFRSKL